MSKVTNGGRTKGVSVRNLNVSYGSLSVIRDLNIEIEPGEFIVLLGASGCGKSTLLSVIAGLRDASGGQIWIGDENVTWHEPKDRDIGMVFQSYALYPQMTVRGNLSFGLRMTGGDKATIEKRVAEAAEVLQLTHLLDRKPRQLSGGQRQRVAIGRALVRQASVFLFDEPLSNLDSKLRTELRSELKRLHKQLGATMIFVTHDQIEALTLADRIAVMEGGKIRQFGTPKEIYRHPENRFVADFIGSPGMNFYDGEVRFRGAEPRFIGDGFDLPLSGYEFAAALTGPTKAVLGVRPEHVRTRLTGQTPFRATTPITSVEPMGAETLLVGRLGANPLGIRVDTLQGLDEASDVEFEIDPSLVSLFSAGSGQRL
ncbi:MULTISPECIES: ABC transporter ATP-binding protein [Rhizobium/Agrobacterium group]|uniref:ABC transporter ATP-binding protein n=1 Tax=Rhizobium/Agrobacterium group TaxID=227290 RepID=UPI001ADABC82|nr:MULTISPECIES: ABC transporter ATP-binding protein [Rhizobium/Agrobacterium group]MBO9112476.1 ABC transporter ATP-binding protein [Agrobacterium sp. S2/73]QXZ75985.1 ABC transporter ATP-binding protein [Agrobacterium sp. S7/73]QYA17004.1 ABC transporter ATP-binding protein [Rhizobium sp. AB2/73]UEQ85423.1 ABC transporter ATP-binding protein [Rhizobium sp. AB2/73]